MPTQPTAVDPGPGVPNRITDDEATYDQDMEAFDTWVEDEAVPGMHALAQVAYANAQESAVAAATATAQSQAAIAVINAAKWAVGNYAEGQAVWSPENGRTYRARAAFASAVDPVNQLSAWFDVASFRLETVVELTTAVALGVGMTSLLCTDGLAYPLPLSPTMGEWVGYRVISGGGVGSSLDPGPANKVEGKPGLFRLDHPAAMGKLAWTGAARGWVHVP